MEDLSGFLHCGFSPKHSLATYADTFISKASNNSSKFFGFPECAVFINKFRVIQSINQWNFYSAHIPRIARLSGATSKSVLNSAIDEPVPQCQQVIGHAGVYGEKDRSKRYVLKHFQEVETEVDGRTDIDPLFQREGHKS